MILKSISMKPESHRRSMLRRFAGLVDEGRSIWEIANELDIPEEEIREAIEWVKQVKESPNAN